MGTLQKIILTIVIAVLVTGGFGLIAYTGLFRLLEIDFFSSRVESDQRIRLKDISDIIVLWNQENLSRFDSLSRDRNMQSVFSISQRQEEILYRAQLSDSLKDQLLGFEGIRVVDNVGRIQFSSFAGDVSSRQFGDDSRILYRNWSETDESFELPIADENSVSVTYYDEAKQQIRYRLPIQDWGFVTRGWMIVYMGLSGLSDSLARDGLIAQGANSYVVEDRGIIADIRPEQVAAVKEEIDILWPIDGVPSDFSVLAKGPDEKYWLAGTISSDGTWVGKLIPGHLFSFSTAVRMLVFATVFLTSALLVFLFLNLRQDKTEVLRGRIKKLQVNLLRSWLEHNEKKKLSLKDFEARRDEVRTELRSGLGRLKKDESAKVDEIIDEGWTRIAEILAEKESDVKTASISSNTVVKQESIDMKLLENMIARAVSAAQIATAQIQHVQSPPQTREGELIKTEKVSELAEELAVEEQSEAADETTLEIVGEDAELEELSEVEESLKVAEASMEELAVEEQSEAADETTLEIVGEDAELEVLSEVEESLKVAGASIEELAVEEQSEAAAGATLEIVGEDAELEVLSEVEESLKVAEASMEELADNTIERDELSESSSEALEDLPVVFADAFGELIEIGKLKQSKLYTFEGAPDGAYENVIGDLESLDEDRADDLEEIEKPVTADKLNSAPESDSMDKVVFIPVAEVVGKYGKSKPNKVNDENFEHGDSIESLIKSRTTGILPSAESDDKDLHFAHDFPKLSWQEDGLNYDQYLREFESGSAGVFKSLMKLSKEYKANCGTLFLNSKKGLEADCSVGLSDECAIQLSVTRDEKIWSEWFERRLMVLIPNLSNSLYANKIEHYEFRYIHAALLIPIIYSGTPSYLFFGFKKAPEDPMGLLIGSTAVGSAF